MALAFASRRTLLLLASLPLLATPAFAQDVQDDEDEYQASTIVVTGARIRQGGAQDIQHFRSMSGDELRTRGLPRTDSLTVEGLMGEHDLTLPSTGDCDQLFCVAAHVMPSQLAGRDVEQHFLGIGFESGIDADAYRAIPLSLIAVVDRSGSMSRAPIERVKESLHAAVDNMREGDRMGIVIYGSTTMVHQPAIDVDGNRDALHRAIDAIAIDGATSMEAGMQLGFATAFEEMEQSRGKTRLMLFTDENPNVGNTSPEGFMGQALAGSRRGVGMTTIGVGAHFDGALATQISSVRGGNLFFVPQEGSASELFANEFENMVSEVAQDIVISIDPAAGYSVSNIYGVPGEMISNTGEGTVTVTIGSAFLSSNGGGIFATMEGGADTGGLAAGPSLAEISVSYTDAISQRRENDSDAVMAASGPAPANLAKAHMLVDQYVSMTQALALYHDGKDVAGAAEMLASLSARMDDVDLEGMEAEVELVNDLRDNAMQLAGIDLGRTLPWHVLGEWRVVRQSRVTDLARGDRVSITEDGDFITERRSGRDNGDGIYQTFAINDRELHIEGTGLVFNYRLRGERLILRNRLDGVEIVLEPEVS